ncbi:murein biosynthesis integral membrane protein MurJ [Bdellovibrionota bacterium FG-1]
MSSDRVLRNASAVGVATLCSRILGLVREQVFAFLFGAGNFTDAFNVAFRIPNLLRNLFAEGAMNAALVPTFTLARQEEGEQSAWRVAGLVFRVLMVLAGSLTVLGVVFAPQLVSLYASAFRDVPGKFELTIRMTRWLFPYFPMVTLAAAYMGVLNACGIFFIPAFSAALFNLVSIASGVTAASFLWKWGGTWQIHPIEGMALGVLVGGSVQAFCQLPALYRAGYRWIPRRGPSGKEDVWYRNVHLRRMLWMMVPSLLGLAATQFSVFVNTVLATTQGTGAVSWLHYSFRLMQFPIGVFGVSLASATLPVISSQWIKGDVVGVQRTLEQGLRRVFAINLPASAGLAFLGGPIIALIFQYGRFTAHDTQATALALAMYAIGLTAYSAVKLLVPACYAMGNARLPVLASLISVGVAVGLNWVWVGPLGYWSLALGTSVAAVLNALLLIGSLKWLLGEAGGAALPLGSLGVVFVKHGAVALLMGVLVYLSYWGFDFLLPDLVFAGFFGKLGFVLARALKLSVVILEGLFLVYGLSWVFRATETMDGVNLFVKKIKNKVRHGQT